ncbi:MAG: hypothetical protein WA609_08105, partial [Terriglobales bacterium]
PIDRKAWESRGPYGRDPDPAIMVAGPPALDLSTHHGVEAETGPAPSPVRERRDGTKKRRGSPRL